MDLNDFYTLAAVHVGEQKYLFAPVRGSQTLDHYPVAWSLYQLSCPGSRHRWDININTDLKYDGKVWTGSSGLDYIRFFIPPSGPKLYRTHQRQTRMNMEEI